MAFRRFTVRWYNRKTSGLGGPHFLRYHTTESSRLNKQFFILPIFLFSQVEFASALLNKQVHTDAFFRSQRDINRHHCWLHFWKIQINSENFIFLPFWGRLGEIFQKWPYFLVFERIFFWNFDLKIIFFKQKQDFVIFIWPYMYEYLKPDFKNLISGLSESV